MGTIICGWCITGHHNQHKKSGSYYDKTWDCPCAACAHKEAMDKKKKEKEDKDEHA